MPETLLFLLLNCLAAPVTLLAAGPSGDPLAGAFVEATTPGVTIAGDTTQPGVFFLTRPPGHRIDARVSAPGYAPRTVSVGPGACDAVRVQLLPLVDGEVVTVTPERSAAPLATTAAPISVVTGDDLARAPQRALDEVLRGTPGFSLFRASSSRVANPTAQGVTLRGLGGSGGSA